MHYLKYNCLWLCLFWFFLHLCFYIKEIQALCWTWSSVFPKSFHRVSAQLSIQGRGREWKMMMKMWACWDWMGFAQVRPSSWLCREPCPHAAGHGQASTFSLPLSPQTPGFKEAMLEYKLYKAWVCIHRTALSPALSTWVELLIVRQLMFAQWIHKLIEWILETWLKNLHCLWKPFDLLGHSTGNQDF